MKFRVGDKVKILDGENIPNYVQGWNMPEYVGDVVTIKERILYPDNYIGYRVEENLYIFDERGLAPAMNIEVQPLELVCNQEKAKEIAERLTKELNGMLGVSFKKNKEEKKMSTKFTFYMEEGYRIDKSNNSKVETITTFVKINNTYLGMATCDKADYSERDGILNAIANAVLGGNFDREYEKFLADKKHKYDESCKCKICGRNYYEDENTGKRTPFTPEDARKHKEWHEQNKKNKREKYLIRKEAKRRLAEAEREGKIEQTMKELYKK